MVPIHLPPADRPPASVLAVEARLLSRDGQYHVGQNYFADPFDAERVRRLAAERIVREQERLGRICSWCLEEIRNGQFSKVGAGKRVHDHCAAEFGAWTAAQPAIAAKVVGALQSSTVVELPSNEAQARPLARLEPDQQREAWSCRMVNEYPRVDECGKPTVRGYRRASVYPDKRPAETYPCCADCQQRLGIADRRMRTL